MCRVAGQGLGLLKPGGRLCTVAEVPNPEPGSPGAFQKTVFLVI